MFLKVVKKLVDGLRDEEKAKAFMEMVELRQRMYRTHKDNVLILDPYDLIADHLLIYSSRDERLMGYQRSISAQACKDHDLDFPMEALLRGRVGLAEGYRAFQEQAKDILHMGYLCLDPDYRSEIEGIKIIDFTTWACFRVSGMPRESVALTASLNNRYKQDPYLRNIGEWIPNLPDLKHPVIPDPHRIVLIPKVREGYWAEQDEKYMQVYRMIEEVSTKRSARDVPKVA